MPYPLPDNKQFCLCKKIVYTWAIQLIVFTIFLLPATAEAQKPNDTLLYRRTVISFTDTITRDFLVELRANGALYQEVFGPCLTGQDNGVMTVRKNFQSMLASRVRAAISQVYQSNRGFIYFRRRSELVVQQDAGYEVERKVNQLYRVLITICNNGLPPSRVNNPPDANAGADQSVLLPDNNATLTGAGTDPDPDTLTYNWTKLSGPAGGTIVSPAEAVTEVTGLTEGVYQFVLTVSDNRDGYDSDTTVINVFPPEIIKLPPSANAGPDITINENQSVMLTGEGTDPDGTIEAFTWKMIKGPDKYNIASPFSPQTEIAGLQAGDYTFELTVKDNDGLSASDTMLLHVDPVKAIVTPARPWLWILIIIGLLTATASSWYFFIWLRVRKKLILYFMSSKEEALAEELMSKYDKTEGYLVGHATRSNIRRMKKEGLAFRLLTPSVLNINTPGEIRTYQYSLKKGEYVLKNVTHQTKGHQFVNILAGAKAAYLESALPAYYLLTLDSPLLPQFEEQLEAIGLPVLRKVPQYSYVVQVKEQSQLEQIRDKKAFPFIRLAQQYTAADTGFTVHKEGDTIAKADGKEGILTLDIVLHSKDDLEKVAEQLAASGAEATGSFNRTIRIRVKRNAINAAELAANKYIQAIYEHLPPELHNDVARRMVGIDDGDPPAAVFQETGKGEVIAVADSGIDEDHPDLAGSIIKAVAWGRKNDTSDPNGHGTHVAGTIIGNGKASGQLIKGMAPEAKIFFQSLLDKDGKLCDLEMEFYNLLQEAYDNEARIINFSWGAAQESYYTVESEMVDQFVYENQDMLILVAAGNEAQKVKEQLGTEAAPTGIMSSPATTKNGFTVGASMSIKGNGDAESLAPFSNSGPCDDYRIKPDIVAPGTRILSARSSEAPGDKFDELDKNEAYAYLGGTSMATPVVAGAAALVREYYKTERGYKKPSAALIKATLLNGTRRLTGVSAMQDSNMIPNNHQGYGVLNMLNTIPGRKADYALWYVDSLADTSLVFTQPGEERYWRLQLTTQSWIRICMVFLDKPGRSTQADLTLLMSQEDTTTKWWGNAGINSDNKFFKHREDDFTNNIEIIRVEEAAPGSYKIAIKATNKKYDEVAFALVVTTGDTTSKFTPAKK